MLYYVACGQAPQLEQGLREEKRVGEPVDLVLTLPIRPCNYPVTHTVSVNDMSITLLHLSNYEVFNS